MAMRGRNHTSLGLFLALVLFWGCAPRIPPALPPGLALEPGRYLTACYRAPDFAPSQATYAIAPFTVGEVQGLPPATVQDLLQKELVRGWQANGLKLASPGDATLSGTMQLAAIRGTSVRFLTGKIGADLVVSGTISRADHILFAFQDRVHLTSPVSPGPPAPKEDELLMHQAVRTFVVHLLNELLLYWPEAEGK
jgi:hypothetical protein